MTKNNITKRKFAKLPLRPNRKAAALLKTLLPLAIVVVGILVAFVLIKLRRPPRRKEHQIVPPLVEVQQLYVQDIQMVVRGYGTVSPKAQVDLVPEVSGKVVSINPQLKAGGFIPTREQILQIDPRDYELAVQQAKALVADAQVRLDIELAEADVARREWGELHPNTEPNSPLVLREPQIRQATAALQSARAQLATAQLRLERTSLSLPFDGMVVTETVDLGQYINAGQPIGKIYSIEAVEIEVPLEDWELAWFDIPPNPVSINGHSSPRAGSQVEVHAKFAGGQHLWQGRVVRTTGQVDTTSRMVSVVVEVPEPFKGADGRPPLVPGMFVEVIIKGKTLANAIAVPRFAIHNKNQLWLVNNDRLHITELDVVRRDRDYAYVTSGLEDGAAIVVSSLDTVTEAMQVRTETAESAEHALPDVRSANQHQGDR